MLGNTNAVIVQGGGDVIYPVNDSGAEYAAKDKVFLNFRGITVNAKQVTNRGGSSYYYYPAGTEMYAAAGTELMRCVYREEDKLWDEQVLGGTGLIGDFVQTFRDKTVVLRNYVYIRNNIPPSAIANGELNPELSGLYLGNNLCLHSTDTENILDLREYNPVNGTAGEIYFTFPNSGYIYAALFDGAYLITVQDTGSPTFRFYDASDKTAPVLLNTQKTAGYLQLKSATGTDAGDFLFGTDSVNDTGYYNVGALRIFQIDTVPSLVDPSGLPADLQGLIGQTASVFYDNRTNILTVGTHDKVYAWRFDEATKTFSSLNIDIDLSEIINMHEEAVFMLSLTEDLKTAAVCYRRYTQTGVYPVTMLYKFINGDGWTIVGLNNVTAQTITGFITGNKDASGRYEVSTVLPAELSLTVNVAPYPDTFEFQGEAE